MCAHSVPMKCVFCDWFVSIMLETSFNLIEGTKWSKPSSKWGTKTYIKIFLDIWHLGIYNSLCNFNLLTEKECSMKFSNMFLSNMFKYLLCIVICSREFVFKFRRKFVLVTFYLRIESVLEGRWCSSFKLGHVWK